MRAKMFKDTDQVSWGGALPRVSNGFSSSSQFDLVCVNAWMLDLTQAILNLGFLAGAFTLGYAADR